MGRVPHRPACDELLLPLKLALSAFTEQPQSEFRL
jgi:hypothetical protein